MDNKDWDALVKKLAPLVLEELMANSTASGEIGAVDSLDGVKALAAIIREEGTERTVEVPLSLLTKPIDDIVAICEQAAASVVDAIAQTDAATGEALDAATAASMAAELASQAAGIIAKMQIELIDQIEEARLASKEARDEAAKSREATDAANTAAGEAGSAADRANEAAANVKDGKTPQLKMGEVETLAPGADATAQVVLAKEPDAAGNPVYNVLLGIPRGEQGRGLDYNTMTPEQIAGIKGKSAYEEAVENGFEGTIEEWLASLNGKDAKSLYELWLEAGNEGSIEEFLDAMTPEDGIDGRDFEVPTLPDFPTAETLTYEVDGAPVAFRVGQIARVFDAEKQEWVFYQLFDIADGKAVWKLVGDTSELAEVARTGSYNDLLDKPATDTFGPLNITEMFDFPSEAEFIAELHRSVREGGRDQVTIRADDTTGITSDLIITPRLGFGSAYSKYVAGHTASATSTSVAFTPYVIAIMAELANGTPGQIRIPKECESVDTFYFVGPSNATSYYVADGILRPFSIADTPLKAFRSHQATINGRTVKADSITSLFFGDEYEDAEVPADFLIAYYNRVSKLRLPVFSQTYIPNRCLYQLYGIEELSFDCFANAISVGDSVWNGTTTAKATRADLRGLANAKTIGSNFMQYWPQLSDIQIGGVDWSAKTAPRSNPFTNIPNTAACVLRADSADLAQAFKIFAMYSSPTNSTRPFDKWSVVINEPAS